MNFNKIFKTGLIALITGSLGYFVYANGSSDDAKADVDLEIVESIEITKDQDMNFGQITYSGGGSVELDFSGNLSATGDVEIFDDGNAQAAIFDVSGEDNTAFSVTFPDGDIDLTGDSHNDLITVDNFQEDAASELDGSGDETFNVSANATIDGDESVDTYNGEFTVEVSYD